MISIVGLDIEHNFRMNSHCQVDLWLTQENLIILSNNTGHKVKIVSECMAYIAILYEHHIVNQPLARSWWATSNCGYQL